MIPFIFHVVFVLLILAIGCQIGEAHTKLWVEGLCDKLIESRDNDGN